MKSIKNILFTSLIGILTAAILLTGCGPDEPTVEVAQAQVNAWIDKPVTNTLHPLAPIEIVFHGAAGQSIAAYQLFVDDQLVEAGSPTGSGFNIFGNLETITTTWNPNAPGEYTLKAQVQSNDGEWSGSAAVTITILAGTPLSPTETLTPSITPTLTITPTSTITPTVQSGTVFSEPSVSTELFYYRFRLRRSQSQYCHHPGECLGPGRDSEC